ncbi:hypothetical protein [Hymenobacter negativus]|uniref:Uncharacterized protein n=1 Tax=Hymenobacter negativus TaxID=2795026 RepID=A0ABS3QL02_9BACT|nr:hypothetical protein [Hymenobacter negativus]MBO2011923.1 hypothetical protein [Hymenobacter negativus]
MLHRYVLAFLLLLTLGTAHGQTPTPASTGWVPFTLNRQDTARAVHELFKSRRGGGFGWLAFGGAGMAASIIPAQQSTSAGVWTPGVVIGSGLALLGTKKLIQFGWGRERRVLRDLAATGHLPAGVRRRLRGNFTPLHSTSSADNPLLTKGVAPDNASAPVVSLVQQQADARQDTLDAIQGYFNAKRLGGQLPILLALPGLGLMTGATKTGTSTSPYGQTQSSDPPAGQVAAGLLLMAGGVTYMFVHNAPYSDTKFRTLRDNYLAGNPLPPSVRTHLKPQHLAAGRKYRERMERKAARRR